MPHKTKTMARYGVIFITAEEVSISGEIYDYTDRILVDEFDRSRIFLLWQGQKKGRQDYIVVTGDREIHVCGRRKQGEYYKYYGVIDAPTLEMRLEGDHSESIPNSYFMKLKPSERCPVLRTRLTGPESPQKQAIQSLGFRYNGGCCGIYKVWV